MSWDPYDGPDKDRGDNNGLIRLYHTLNLFDGSDWTTEGTISGHLWCYFFVPANFIKVGANTFEYQRCFKFVHEQVEVNGKVTGVPHGFTATEGGPQPLEQGYITDGKVVDGKTVKIWHADYVDRKTSQMKTSKINRLPYLVIPDYGDPGYKESIEYFKPVPGVW